MRWMSAADTNVLRKDKQIDILTDSHISIKKRHQYPRKIFFCPKMFRSFLQVTRNLEFEFQ